MSSSLAGNSCAISEYEINDNRESPNEYLEYIPKLLTKLETTKLCKLSLKKWNSLLFISNIAALLLTAASFATPRWVEQGNEGLFWRGGLLKCTGCSGKFRNQYYSYIINISCNSLKGYCETFTGLYIGGICVVLSYFLFLVLNFGWSVVIVLENYGKEIKKRYFGVLAVGTPTSLCVGIVVWHFMTGAGYRGKCYVEATSINDAKGLCAIDGPIILIVAFGMSVLTSGIFYFIKYSVDLKHTVRVAPYKL